jgi:plasmid stabilization system protein ParE
VKGIRFTAPARLEFLAQVAYYNDKESGLGIRFASAVEEAAARALAFPLTGSPAPMDTRRVFVRDFPFSIVYRPDADGLIVFAVAHHSRCPEYWKSPSRER